MHNVIMKEKMGILNGLPNRKGWVLNLSIMSKSLLNGMAMLNGNLLVV